MIKFLKKYFEWVLGFIGIIFVLILISLSAKVLTDALGHVNRAFSNSSVNETMTEFDLEGAKSIGLIPPAEDGSSGEDENAATSSENIERP